MLYKHQQQLIDLGPKKHGLFWQTGVGKTLTAIKLADKSRQVCLVICPKTLKPNWIREIRKHSSNYEKYIVLTKEVSRKDFIKIGKFNCLIIDECHYFVGMKSQMSKALIKYINYYKPEYFYALSATPYLSSAWNVYVLAQLFGIKYNFVQFQYKCFDKVKMGGKFIPIQKKNIDSQLVELIKTFGSTVRLSDCVDLPEDIISYEYLTFTQEQKRPHNGCRPQKRRRI